MEQNPRIFSLSLALCVDGDEEEVRRRVENPRGGKKAIPANGELHWMWVLRLPTLLFPVATVVDVLYAARLRRRRDKPHHRGRFGDDACSLCGCLSSHPTGAANVLLFNTHTDAKMRLRG